eukprot:2480602-Amphidinium_carterae.1
MPVVIQVNNMLQVSGTSALRLVESPWSLLGLLGGGVSSLPCTVPSVVQDSAQARPVCRHR